MPAVQRRVTPNGKIRYRALVRVTGHKSKTATFIKRTDAVIWAQETETRIRQSQYFPNRLAASEKYTLGDLLDRYRREVLPRKRDKKQTGQLEWWKSQLGEYRLKEMSSSRISLCRDRLIGETSERTGRKRTAATVNRYLALLSHVFTIAVKEWEWMAVNPVTQISKLKESRGRTRFLSDKEREKLLNACRSSESVFLFVIVTLALSTGMRKGEILGMKWENVDLKKKRITLVETKNGETRVVPLVGKAYELIRDLYLNIKPLSNDRVFPSTNTPTQFRSIRTAWEQH